MSFMEHLGELRTRIVRSLLALLVGLLVTFPFAEKIVDYLARPIKKMGYTLIFTSPTEAFWVQMKVALIAALFVAAPGILWQVWRFVEPGLHPTERKYAVPFILVGSLMFIGGGAFSLLVVTPFALNFLLSYARPGLTPMITLQNHVDFLLKFTLAFGAVFELPLLITLLTRMGVVTTKTLAKNRKYAILGAFVISAVLTPTPDIFNQTLMAGPLSCSMRSVFSRSPLGPPADQALRPDRRMASRRPERQRRRRPRPPPADRTGLQTMMDFALWICPAPVTQGIRQAGFVTTTPIQEAALPLALKGKDVAGQSQTGTGKTAAFLIAGFTRLLQSPRPCSRVWAPRRACSSSLPPGSWSCRSRQMRTFSARSRHSGPWPSTEASTTPSSATRSPPARTSWWARPGRLIDYLKQHVWSPRRVEVLVVDEADRMFDMGFISRPALPSSPAAARLRSASRSSSRPPSPSACWS